MKYGTLGDLRSMLFKHPEWPDELLLSIMDAAGDVHHVTIMGLQHQFIHDGRPIEDPLVVLVFGVDMA
jgi:hypothetical protein